MWFGKGKKDNTTLQDNDNRPIKFVETEHNVWQIVYADEYTPTEKEKS